METAYTAYTHLWTHIYRCVSHKHTLYCNSCICGTLHTEKTFYMMYFSYVILLNHEIGREKKSQLICLKSLDIKMEFDDRP